IQIFVKTLTGKHATFQTTPFAEVEDILDKVQRHEGLPSRDIRLLFGGRQLEAKRLLSDYNIQDGSTIHLVLRRDLFLGL
ncbi:ubiquitin in A New crystal form, partial [Diaporthe sp. PMI_573]